MRNLTALCSLVVCITSLACSSEPEPTDAENADTGAEDVREGAEECEALSASQCASTDGCFAMANGALWDAALECFARVDEPYGCSSQSDWGGAETHALDSSGQCWLLPSTYIPSSWTAIDVDTLPKQQCTLTNARCE